jgi:DNA-binding transcriptional LysR family regulator
VVDVLFDEPFVVVVGRNSKWAKQRHVRLADLVNERWVLPPLPVLLRTVHGAFDAAGLQRPQPDVMTLSIHVHNSLLATGKFVTAVPSSTFGWGADYLPFKVLPIEMPTTFGPVAIVTLRGRTLSRLRQVTWVGTLTVPASTDDLDRRIPDHQGRDVSTRHDALGSRPMTSFRDHVRERIVYADTFQL